MSTALPIPLSVEDPPGSRLVAWMYWPPLDARPAECLLAVSGPDRPWRAGGSSSWTVRTHFGPVRIAARAGNLPEVLGPADDPAFLRALLHAVTRESADVISAALVDMAETVAALRTEMPALPARIAPDGIMSLEQAPDFVPRHAVVGSAAGPSIVPVTGIDIVFEGGTGCRITLGSIAPGHRCDVLFLVGDRTFVAIAGTDRDV